MAKSKRTETEIVKVDGVDPAWLAQYVDEDESMVGMDEYRILPRIKIVQSMTNNELKKKFGEGSLIVRPGDALVWKDGDDPVKFVPLFFCVEFAKWADLRDNTSLAIVERSYDPTSDVAKCAKSNDDRYEEYPDQGKKKEADRLKFRYVEHLRFLGIIYGNHELSGQYASLSFERGEFKQGKNFISAIKMRKIKVTMPDGTERSVPAPLWAQVWELAGKFRDQGDKKWYGIDFAPAEPPLIEMGEFDTFKAYHDELKELFEKQRLLVDDEDRGTEAGVSPNSEY